MPWKAKPIVDAPHMTQSMCTMPSVTSKKDPITRSIAMFMTKCCSDTCANVAERLRYHSCPAPGMYCIDDWSTQS